MEREDAGGVGGMERWLLLSLWPVLAAGKGKSDGMGSLVLHGIGACPGTFGFPGTEVMFKSVE